MSAYHVSPQPKTVATIVDEYGHHFARERWGWLHPNVLSTMAAEGGRIRGNVPARKRTSPLSGGHDLVSLDWDGPVGRSPALTPAVAAAALSVSASSLSRRG